MNLEYFRDSFFLNHFKMAIFTFAVSVSKNIIRQYYMWYFLLLLSKRGYPDSNRNTRLPCMWKYLLCASLPRHIFLRCSNQLSYIPNLKTDYMFLQNIVNLLLPSLLIKWNRIEILLDTKEIDGLDVNFPFIKRKYISKFLLFNCCMCLI